MIRIVGCVCGAYHQSPNRQKLLARHCRLRYAQACGPSAGRVPPVGLAGSIVSPSPLPWFAELLGALVARRDLTEDQTKKAERIKSSYKKETIKLGADIKVAEIELKELTSEETVNLEKVKEKIKEIEGLKARLRLYRIEKLEEFKKILDAKQVKKLREVFYKSRGYSSGWGGEGGECEGVKEGEGEEGVE